ncbi:uncharacterized protein A1O9_08456, partial [Exophiala aquamarina CBS 119918]
MQAYDSLAAHMGCEPDLLIFRRFLILHVRNLLLFQSQIVEKEAQLIESIELDRGSGNKERESFASMFSAMMNSNLVFESPELSQKKIALELRPLLKDFGEALLLFKNLRDLPPVEPFSLNTLRVIQRGRGQSSFLQWPESHIWIPENEPDLTSLTSRRKEMDTISNWLSWFRIKVFHRYWGSRSAQEVRIPSNWTPEYAPRIRSYSEESTSGLVNILRTIMGPLLTTTSAFCLFFIDDPVKQMGMVVVSSFLFSILLALITVPAKTETVIATATFTAVLVVFVGQNVQSSPCQ